MGQLLTIADVVVNPDLNGVVRPKQVVARIGVCHVPLAAIVVACGSRVFLPSDVSYKAK